MYLQPILLNKARLFYCIKNIFKGNNLYIMKLLSKVQLLDHKSHLVSIHSTAMWSLVKLSQVSLIDVDDIEYDSVLCVMMFAEQAVILLSSVIASLCN